MKKVHVLLATVFVTALTAGCSDVSENNRKVGSSLDGEWAFGKNPNCGQPKSVVTIYGRSWHMLNPNNETVKLIEMLGSDWVGKELLLELQFEKQPELEKNGPDVLKIYFEDNGDKLNATAVHIRNNRVPLDVVDITIDTAPFYFLTKC